MGSDSLYFGMTIFELVELSIKQGLLTEVGIVHL